MDKNREANVSLFTKVLLFLYLVVGLSPKVVELEYEGFQWFYFSVLNSISLLFIFWQRAVLNPFQIDKKAKQFFLIFLLFLLVSIASVTQSINVSESVVQLLRLINVITAIYSFYILTRKNPKTFFIFIAKVCTGLMIYHSIITMQHFIGNYTKPRTVSLYKSFLHYFGNINFFSAGLILKIPFAIYLFLRGKTLWRFISSIAILITILSLMFSGSRTAMLSLVIILFFMILYLLFNLKENKKERILQISYFIIVPFFAFFIFANTNKLDRKKTNSVSDIFKYYDDNYKKQGRLKKKDPKLFETDVVLPKKYDSFRQLLNKTGRGNIWPWALLISKENPLLGVGYGNYKVNPKEKYFKEKTNPKGKYSISIRVHNDFLEKYVETGIIGGTLHLLLFIFIFLLMFKLFKKSKNKEIVLVLFLSGIAFTLDSFFNFPTERAPIYLFFILIVAFILALNSEENFTINTDSNTSELKKVLYYLLITVIVVSSGLNFLVYKAYTENTIFKNQKEFKRRKYDLTYEGLKNRIYSFPDLDQDAIKMGYYLASYAALEKKWDKSLAALNDNIDVDESAQNYILKKLKAEIYLKAYKNVDSAEYYYKQNFDRFPAYKQNYSMLKNIYKAKEENKKLENLMNSYTSQNYVDFKEWINKANYYYQKTKDINLGVKILDTALAYNKNNIEILEAKLKLKKQKQTNSYYKTEDTKKQYTKAIKLYNKRKYAKALKIFYALVKRNPNDYYAIQYIGITEMNLKNYKTAVKFLTETINKKIFKDGKAEFCRGICYEKLGEIEKSKKDYSASRKKKFPRALKLPKEKYE